MKGRDDTTYGSDEDLDEALHAYADGELDRDPDRCRAVEARLAADPQALRKVEDIRAINEGIRSAFPLDRETPPRLHTAFGPRSWPSLPGIGHTAAAVAATLAIGFLAGHLTGVSGGGSMPEETLAVLAGEDPDPGRMAADAAMAGVQAVRAGAEPDRLEMGRGLPNFAGAGFALSDVTRTVARDGQSLVRARYDNPASGETVELAVMPMPRTPVPPQGGPEGNGDRIFWSDGLLAYGLKAREGQPDLDALARLASSGGNWMLTASESPVAGGESIEAAPITTPLPAADAAPPPAGSGMSNGARPVLPAGDRRGS